jgi:copper resistance protein D
VVENRSWLSARAACYGLDRFSAIGSAVIVSLILSGLINSWFLIGVANWRALFTTAYGVALLIKLALFALMLALAAMNRFRWAPRLRDELENEQHPTRWQVYAN